MNARGKLIAAYVVMAFAGLGTVTSMFYLHVKIAQNEAEQIAEPQAITPHVDMAKLFAEAAAKKRAARGDKPLCYTGPKLTDDCEPPVIYYETMTSSQQHEFDRIARYVDASVSFALQTHEMSIDPTIMRKSMASIEDELIQRLTELVERNALGGFDVRINSLNSDEKIREGQLVIVVSPVTNSAKIGDDQNMLVYDISFVDDGTIVHVTGPEANYFDPWEASKQGL